MTGITQTSSDSARPHSEPSEALASGDPQADTPGSLRRRLTRVITLLPLLVGLFTLAIATAVTIWNGEESLQRVEEQVALGLLSEGSVLVSSHAQLFESLVADNAILDLHNTVARTVHDDEDVLYGLFVTSAGQVWAYSGPGFAPGIVEPGMALPTHELGAIARRLEIASSSLHVDALKTRELSLHGSPVLEVATPVAVFGEPAGTLRYGLSTRRTQAALATAHQQSEATLVRTAIILGTLVLLAFGISTFVARRMSLAITRPIGALTEAARALSLGQRAVKVSANTGDEIETLAHAFNTMVRDLDTSYEALAEQNRVIRREMEERQRAEAERVDIEDRLIQAQKMEAFGQIAGGVAHDFNNVLAVVVGQAELTLNTLDDTTKETLEEDLNNLLEAGTRGADLTRQLLTFARKEANHPKVVSPSDVSGRLEKMLRRVIEEHVEIVIKLADNTPRVLIDPGRFEQVIMNLVVNARDAMPKGGTLTLQTRREEVSEPRALSTGEVARGTYAVISVKDTGIGMEASTLARIFEPFFTTKGVGVGTGLGLATVHGIVRDADGVIDVTSTPGQGTTFSVWLRAVQSDAEESAVPSSKFKRLGRGQRVLLCEDETAVRALTTKMLALGGFDVIAASSGAAALEILSSEGAGVKMLITDVVMPGMSGPELVQKIEGRFPNLPILYVSGYTDDLLDEHGVDGRTRRLLRKPFRAAQLIEAVAELFEANQSESGAA